jgi:ribosome modulation factor
MDASVGHNHRLNATEARALFFHHLQPFLQADAAVRDAQAEKKRLKKLAKADGILSRDLDFALRVATIEDSDVLLEEHANRAKILAWQGVLPGTQAIFDFDREPAIDRAAREGEAAGFNGRDATPPYDASSSQGQKWLAAWHVGNKARTEALASALEKVGADRPETADDEEDDDFGEDPD